MIFLPIIFYCSDNTGYTCHTLTRIGRCMESIMSWSFISKSLICIAMLGALVNYVVSLLRRLECECRL